MVLSRGTDGPKTNIQLRSFKQVKTQQLVNSSLLFQPQGSWTSLRAVSYIQSTIAQRSLTSRWIPHSMFLPQQKPNVHLLSGMLTAFRYILENCIDCQTSPGRLLATQDTHMGWLGTLCSVQSGQRGDDIET